MEQQIKHVGDGMAFALASATLLTAWLPPIAALCSIVWYGLRFYEYWKTKQIKD